MNLMNFDCVLISELQAPVERIKVIFIIIVIFAFKHSFG